MDYAAVLKRTWDITWRYKGLWVLGILAGCGGRGGGGGGGSPPSSGMNFSGGSGDLPEGMSQAFTSIEQFFNSVDEAVLIAAAIALVLFFLLLGVIFFLIGIAGQAGLLHGFNRADEGEIVTLGSALRGGLQYFLRLLGLRLLLMIVGFVVALVIIAGIVGVSVLTLGIGLICLIPMICLLIPVGIAVSIYIQLTEVTLVVEDSDILAAFRQAWEVLRANPVPILVMALILFFGGGLAGLIIAAPLILLVIPVVGGIALGSGTSMSVGVGLAALGFLIWLPIAIVLGGIIQTYVQGGWTVTYRRLSGRDASPELGSIEA